MKLALFGYGGHAREVAAQINQKITFFADDIYANNLIKPISEFEPEKYKIMVAVGNSKDRFEIVKKFPKETIFFTWIHPTAIILDDVEIGEGSFIGAYSILTINIKIGKHAILNRSVQIGHDVEIGNYFSAMPGVVVSGNCKIYDYVYIGSNSSIREKLSVNSFSNIGMNSCVTKNIVKSGTYVGVPSKKIK